MLVRVFFFCCFFFKWLGAKRSFLTLVYIESFKESQLMLLFGRKIPHTSKSGICINALINRDECRGESAALL